MIRLGEGDIVRHPLVADKLESVANIAVVRLGDADIVRHPLVASMLGVL